MSKNLPPNQAPKTAPNWWQIKQIPDKVAKYLGPINESIIAFVIGTVASQNIPIRAPNKIAIVGEGGDKTNMVIANDLNKYIIDKGIGFLIFPPSHPKPNVPRILVTPMIAKDQPATSIEIPFDTKSAGRCKAIKVTWKPQTKKPRINSK